MDEGNEIFFIGKYKDFRLGVHFGLGGKTPQDAAYALGYISQRISEQAFHFSGINIAKIKSFARPEGKGIRGIISFLEKNPQALIKEALLEGIADEKLLPAAESFFFSQMLTNAQVAFRITDDLIKSDIVPEEIEPEGKIAFVGNYGGWISIKKLSLGEVQDYEVSGILSGIENTIANKAFGFSGCKSSDEAVNKLVKGKKSIGNLTEALKGLDASLSGNALDDAYLVCKVFEKQGYKPYASPEMLTNAYPDIKPPKVKGRKPKG